MVSGNIFYFYLYFWKIVFIFRFKNFSKHVCFVSFSLLFLLTSYSHFTTLCTLLLVLLLLYISLNTHKLPQNLPPLRSKHNITLHLLWSWKTLPTWNCRWWRKEKEVQLRKLKDFRDSLMKEREKNKNKNPGMHAPVKVMETFLLGTMESFFVLSLWQEIAEGWSFMLDSIDSEQSWSPSFCSLD